MSGFGKMIKNCQATLEELDAKIQILCGYAEGRDVEVVARFLNENFPVQAKWIFGNRSLRGRVGVDSESEHNDAMEIWIFGDGPGDWSDDKSERSIKQLLLVENIWKLKNSERALLYEHWRDASYDALSQHLQELMQSHSSKKQLLTSLMSASQTQFLNKFDIVGVTTTGVANNSDLLRGLRAKFLICEEAGEVLEAHILTVLLPSIQHAILIGDHLQLRPRISNLKLSVEYGRKGPKYNLDESLFERLANSSFGDPGREWI